MATELTRAEVDHIATLARLALSDEERELFRKQLGDILGYIATLNELDTDAIAPSASILPLTDVMHGDEPRPGLSLEQILANAPAQTDSQLRVSSILEDA